MNLLVFECKLEQEQQESNTVRDHPMDGIHVLGNQDLGFSDMKNNKNPIVFSGNTVPNAI